jgi:hypothetical protein
LTSQDVELVYEVENDGAGGALGVTVTIPAGGQSDWEDVMVGLFGLRENAKTQGALHVYAHPDVMVDSRTYNERADSGTLGLKIPALKSNDLIANGETGTMAGLIHTSGTRTNVGLAEFSGQDTKVELLFFGSGQGLKSVYLDKLTIDVPANSHLQITKVFEKLDLGIFSSDDMEAWAWVTVKAGGSVYAYATIVDNGTGDATIATTAKNIN